MRQLMPRVLALVLIGLLGFAAIHVAGPVSVYAQETPAPIDYAEWETVALRAEAATDASEASDEAFATLRAEIVSWREKFIAAQSVNSARIRTLKTQIEALGAAPAEGETETPELAARRTELNTQLSEAQAPIKRAEEAFSRSDGLIAEIDRIVRDRQASMLLKLGPTPINPAIWPKAFRELTTSLHAISSEIVLSWDTPTRRDTFNNELPIALLYLVIAVLLVARGRAAMEAMTSIVLERSKGRARAIAGFITSLGQIIVPALGIFLLVQALRTTGLLGLRGQIVTGALPLIGLVIFGTRWLMLRLFPKRGDIVHLMPTGPEDSRAMRYYGTGVGLLVGLAILLGRISDFENHSDPVRAVLFFPLIALIGISLFRIGRILVRSSQSARSDLADGETSFGLRSLALIGRVAVVLGLIGTVLSAVGYLNAGVFLILPTTFSLALLGLMLVLNDLIREIYALSTHTQAEDAREALTPTLLSVLLALLSLPVFALLWGAKVSDLTEMWTKFQGGFSVGGTQISPSNFLTFAVVFTALFVATRLIQGALRTSVLPKTKIDTGGQNAIISGLGYVGIFLAAVVAITTAGIDLSSLAIVAGALSIGIGFGLQNIVSNFVSGIILLIERPISQGDWIEVGGQEGIVRDISVRSTRIETFDRIDVIVPNADFVSGAVKNWTRGNSIGRVIAPVGVAYGTDTRRVQAILKEIAMEHPLVTMNPEPGVDFMGFGADSLDFRIRAVISDINFFAAVRTELNHRIAERFAEEGIEIPFAQRDVWLRNPETLRQGGGAVVKDDPKVEAAPKADVPTAAGQRSVEGINNVPPGDDDDDGGDGDSR